MHVEHAEKVRVVGAVELRCVAVAVVLDVELEQHGQRNVENMYSNNRQQNVEYRVLTETLDHDDDLSEQQQNVRCLVR